MEAKIIEFVRKRPGMYIGEMGMRGFKSMLGYLFDELLKDLNTKSEIAVSFIKNDWIRIEAQKIDTKHFLRVLHSSDENLIHFGYLSLPVLVALSEELTVQVNGFNSVTNLSAKKGNFIITPSAFQGKKQGLTLDFKLDSGLFQPFEMSYEIINQFIRKYAFLNPGCKITSIDNRTKNDQKNIYDYPLGVSHQLDYEIGMRFYGHPLLRFDFKTIIKEYSYQISFCYMDSWLDKAKITSFADDKELIFGGSLIEGVLDGIIASVKKNHKIGEADINIDRKKVKEGLILVAAVRGKNLVFAGCTKEKLEMPRMRRQIRKYISSELTSHFHSQPDVANKFMDTFRK